MLAVLRIYLRGLLIGCADVVPGVSGATMALLTGVYGRILEVLHACDAKALRFLLRGELRKLFAHLQGAFLLPLLLGMLSGLLLLARTLYWVLQSYPVLFWAFFMGVVWATAYWICRGLPLRKQPVLWGWLSLGVLVSAAVALQPAGGGSAEPQLLVIFLSATVVVCAMLLPGISGSFVLVLLGQYAALLRALAVVDVQVLLVFAMGAALGLLAFGKLIRWVWHRYPRPLLALLAGLMLGSAVRLWPWRIDDRLLLPAAYMAERPGSVAHLLLAIGVASVAVFLVLRWAPKRVYV